MENKSLRFYAIMALWVVLFVLLFVSNRRVDLKTDINKSTSVSVSVEDTVSLSPSVVTTRAYSASDDTYQAFFRILQNASCYQKFNQNVRSIPPFHTLFFLAGCSILVCSASAARHTGLWYGTVRK